MRSILQIGHMPITQPPPIADINKIQGVGALRKQLAKTFLNYYRKQIVLFNSEQVAMPNAFAQLEMIRGANNITARIETKLLPVFRRGGIEEQLQPFITQIEVHAKLGAMAYLAKNHPRLGIKMVEFDAGDTEIKTTGHIVANHLPQGVTLHTNGHIFIFSRFDGLAMTSHGSVECTILQGGIAASNGHVQILLAKGKNAAAIGREVVVENYTADVVRENFRAIGDARQEYVRFGAEIGGGFSR